MAVGIGGNKGRNCAARAGAEASTLCLALRVRSLRSGSFAYTIPRAGHDPLMTPAYPSGPRALGEPLF